MNMNNQLLHTPEGVRDIYAEECARKLAVEQKIQGNKKPAGRKRFKKHEAKGNSFRNQRVFRRFESGRRSSSVFVGHGYAKRARRGLRMVSQLSANKKKRLKTNNSGFFRKK